MPRRRRIFVPGHSVHVIHRGNNRSRIFGETADYHVFLEILKNATRWHGVEVHGFVLMTNHYHLIVTPANEVALPSAMKLLGVEYVDYFNRKYARVGTLWCGRYRGLLVGDDSYWLTCLRYIEQNPVRALMVKTPGDYRWSSYPFHALGQPSSWLAHHHVYRALGTTAAERQEKYRALCDATLTEEELVQQRHLARLRILPAPPGRSEVDALSHASATGVRPPGCPPAARARRATAPQPSSPRSRS